MLTKTKKNTRVQILLTAHQKDFLDNTANIEGKSVSALIRELVETYRQTLKDKQLNEAVEELYSEYETNKELTAFTSLDGEDFYETRRSMADKP
jgi:nitrate/nitrite-specific signal transduction histidine kinase